MIQVKDGTIVRKALPRNGLLSDGRAVSGYNRLPKETLEAEGWVEEEEVIPEYDPSKQELVGPRYGLAKGRAIKTYDVVDSVQQFNVSQEQLDSLNARITALEEKLQAEDAVLKER